MDGYKAFDLGWVCRDFQYEIGKTYELPEGQELKICECGFHFCENPIDVFGYYPMKDDVLIAKVEALGEIQQEGTKFCTDKIKIVREFTRKELQALVLDGKYNTGDCDSGNYNLGNHNSGNYNSGDCNSGNRLTRTEYFQDLPKVRLSDRNEIGGVTMVTNSERFRNIFVVYATEIWALPEEDRE